MTFLFYNYVKSLYVQSYYLKYKFKKSLNLLVLLLILMLSLHYLTTKFSYDKIIALFKRKKKYKSFDYFTHQGKTTEN